MVVGILAVQGAFIAHQRKLEALGVESILVKNSVDFEKVDGLILPGGESTAMKYLLHKHDLWHSLRERLASMPVLATCAGVILLKELNILDLKISRNAYGPQLASQVKSLSVDDGQDSKQIDGFFVRAPLINSIDDPKIKVLSYLDQDPVLLQKESIIASTFHPELSKSSLIHQMFIDNFNSC